MLTKFHSHWLNSQWQTAQNKEIHESQQENNPEILTKQL